MIYWVLWADPFYENLQNPYQPKDTAEGLL